MSRSFASRLNQGFMLLALSHPDDTDSNELPPDHAITLDDLERECELEDEADCEEN